MAREYVPFDAYGLLRRLVDRGPQRVRSVHVEQDSSALYLITRGLASSTSGGARLQNTEAGRSVGAIDYLPP